MIRTTLAGLVLACPTTAPLPATPTGPRPPLVQEDDGRTDRSFPIGWLVRSTEPQPVGLNLIPPASILLDELEDDGWDGPIAHEAWRLDADVLQRLAVRALGDDAVLAGASARCSASTLRVHGNAEEHERVERWLHALGESLHTELVLELYEAEELPPDWGAILRPDEVDAWLARTGALPTHEQRGRLGFRAYLTAETTTALHYDFDVEVSQQIAVGDPQISRLRDRIEVGVWVQGLGDGRLHVRSWGSSTRPVGAPREVPLTAGSTAALQLPELDGSSFESSVVLRDGGAIVHAAQGPRPTAVVLRVRRADPDRRPAGTVPFGILTARPLRTLPRHVTGAPPSGGLIPPDRDLAEPEPALSRNEVEELLLATLAPEEPGDWILLADEAHPARADQDVAAARAVLAEHERRLATTVALEVRFDTLSTDTWTRIRTASDRASDWSSDLGRRLLLASRTGNAARVDAVRTLYYLHDWDLEIMNVTASDPIVADVSSGPRLWFQPDVIGADRVAATIAFGYSEVLSPLARRELDYPLGVEGDRAVQDEPLGVELPTVTLATDEHRVRAAPGEWFPLQVAALPGTDRTLVAVGRFALH